MPKIQLTSSFIGPVVWAAGSIQEVDTKTAKALIGAGYAKPVDEPKKRKAVEPVEKKVEKR